jgi:hypothetical protein
MSIHYRLDIGQVKNYIILTSRNFEVMGDEFYIKTAVHVFTQKVIDKNIIIIIMIFV